MRSQDRTPSDIVASISVVTYQSWVFVTEVGAAMRVGTTHPF